MHPSAAGANSIYGITFDVQDKEAALATGRDQAMADAKAQAEELAKAAGATLGDVQSISYYSSSPSPIYYDNKAASSGCGWWRKCAHFNRTADPDRIRQCDIRHQIRPITAHPSGLNTR